MLTRHRHGKNKKKVIKRMNIRIRNKEDAFFIIGTALLLPLIDFFQDFRIGKKTKKDFNFLLILDCILSILFIIFLILLYVFKLPLL